MFTKRPFHCWKTKLWDPWNEAVTLSAMNKPCSAIMMKDPASPTHGYTGSDALSVEPVSQHWLLVVILSRDWSWQSSACQTQNPVYLSRRAAVAHHSLSALPVSSPGRQSLRQHEDRKTGLIAKLAVPSTLLTPRGLVSCGLSSTVEALVRKLDLTFMFKCLRLTQIFFVCNNLRYSKLVKLHSKKVLGVFSLFF